MDDKFNILSELKEAGAAVLINLDNKNYFFVPDNYFKTLASDVLANVFIKSLPSINPYTVPERYFEALPDLLLEKISIRENVYLSGIDEKSSYTVPDGYFGSFADKVLKKIKSSSYNSIQQELEEISPLLSKISKTNVYSVPANYFDEIDSLEIAGKKLAIETRAISIGSKTRKWVNYAAAACIVALFGSGFLYFFNTPKSVSITLTNTDIQKQISLLSDDEIANYLDANNDIGVYTNIGTDEYQQQSINIQNMLQNISDEEIQQYLNEEPDLTKKEGGI